MKELLIALLTFFHVISPGSKPSTSAKRVVVSPTPSITATPMPSPTVPPTPKPNVGWITGNVGGDGPLPGYLVKIYRLDGTIAATGVSDNGGNFSIALPAGKYYWIQNEDTKDNLNKRGSRRDFTVVAGVKSYDMFSVLSDPPKIN